MTIIVKCFASLREQLGIERISLEYETAMTVGDVWKKITHQRPPENVLSARNHEYVDFSVSLEDGDEVAFFPPVTGG